jgi:hypothetical protein
MAGDDSIASAASNVQRTASFSGSSHAATPVSRPSPRQMGHSVAVARSVAGADAAGCVVADF